ncbi:LEAF RUST 10 DISEASE-RESISTANCE LOCUS RECEPTOR-LIKE PROTEIN KINASE-like 2.4 [Lycium barbarum]|uniref:LEAF RUST 10 DISEASE-RESISTANCE LOCUS RECEPTOR-LIKE PROTEIN KINASE-like 2.4 n=1 Tax=Lycium barbarum TaxID=112863 RepID=UPI00293F6332|nr:LEAF RUST 10 DISEASE-RESISTANCE LOCUS RECEPTOR-LIKE PROTEIN KINASE-like 2.4 [Lycium barbarum]
MSSHKCLFKAYFFHSIITFLFFLITSSLSYGQENEQYTTCNSSYSCGNIQNIGFPFWGGDRPQECGLPEFELECEANEDPVIKIDNHNFRVRAINKDTRTMRIARKDLEDDVCPDSFGNTTLNDALFHYGPDLQAFVLLYGCPFSMPSEWKNFSFSCNNTGDSSLGFYPDESFSSFWGPKYPSCKFKVVVPVMIQEFEQFENQGSTKILELLKQGFDVVYNKSVECMACERSRGLCWLDTDTREQTCLCQDRTYSYNCGYVPDQGTKRAIRVNVVLVIYCSVSKKSCGTCLLLPKKRREHQNIQAFLRQYGSLAPKAYSYSDIRKMTNSLQEKLGQGGYGGVYKGNLNGHPVAVKILNSTKGNGEEFINEVASISKTSHVNVVTLLGFSFNGRERALVYEFMPNGSLDQHIYGEDSKLGWENLYKIALGIGRGLEYLHRGCNARILHFDIKPHNILLDEEFCPKISDFGLAKLCLEKESVISMLGARGTIGYIAPEVFSRNFGGVSHKSDVYSYGMMVLEMVGGRRNYTAERSHHSEIYFPRWAYQCLVTDEDLNIQRITTIEEEEIAKKMILVGLWCIQTDPSQRPPMSKAIEMLEGKLEAIQFPPKPFICSPSRSEGSWMISLEQPTMPFIYSSSGSILDSTASAGEE